MALELNSPAFGQGEAIPKKHTCEGDDISPPLRWRGTPSVTRSLVLLCNDPDAPGGTFRHWAAYDIPPEQTEMTEGHDPETLAGGFKQAINDFGRPGARARPRATARTTTTSGSWRSPRPTCPWARVRAARRSRRSRSAT